MLPVEPGPRRGGHLEGGPHGWIIMDRSQKRGHGLGRIGNQAGHVGEQRRVLIKPLFRSCQFHTTVAPLRVQGLLRHQIIPRFR